MTYNSVSVQPGNKNMQLFCDVEDEHWVVSDFPIYQLKKTPTEGQSSAAHLISNKTPLTPSCGHERSIHM